jgi:hypothetical protein
MAHVAPTATSVSRAVVLPRRTSSSMAPWGMHLQMPYCRPPCRRSLDSGPRFAPQSRGLRLSPALAAVTSAAVIELYYGRTAVRVVAM